MLEVSKNTEESDTRPDRLSRRIGRFRISGTLLAEVLDIGGMGCKALFDLFGRVVVVRAEYFGGHDFYEYTAFSDAFEPIDEGEMAPLYCVDASVTYCRDDTGATTAEPKSCNLAFRRTSGAAGKLWHDAGALSRLNRAFREVAATEVPSD